ncbi:MAG: efflux RND transporter periplasmic adaptor subunit [Deltaproteobacteria bacterium]|nr:efflux RND transporter periplasmic adaptor subunit [Deltaproteobacteria bacterium]
MDRTPPLREARPSRGHAPGSLAQAVAPLHLALALVACRGGAAETMDKSAPAVRVVVAKPVRGDVVRKLRVAASLEPWESVMLYAKASGYVREIKVDRGDRVTKGTVIAVLDVPEANTELERIDAEAKQAIASVEHAKADVRLQEITARRLGAIRSEEPGAASQQDVEMASGKVEVANAALATAESRLDVFRAEKARLSTLAAYAQIAAPFSGVVSERYVDVGALVTAGTTGKPAAIVKLMNPSKFRVVIDVPEVDVPHVVIGNAAELLVDAYPGRKFTGKISRRSEAIDLATRTMRVEIETGNEDGVLSPGMFGRVTIDLETRRDVLSIEPLWMKLQKDQAYVFVVDGGKAKRQNIKIGADDGKSLEVIEGLVPDADVVSSSAKPLSDGTPVVISEAPKTAAR